MPSGIRRRLRLCARGLTTLRTYAYAFFGYAIAAAGGYTLRLAPSMPSGIRRRLRLCARGLTTLRTYAYAFFDGDDCHSHFRGQTTQKKRLIDSATKARGARATFRFATAFG